MSATVVRLQPDTQPRRQWINTSAISTGDTQPRQQLLELVDPYRARKKATLAEIAAGRFPQRALLRSFDALGDHVRVESDGLGQGAGFCFTLPVLQQAA